MTALGCVVVFVSVQLSAVSAPELSLSDQTRTAVPPARTRTGAEKVMLGVEPGVATELAVKLTVASRLATAL